MTYWVLGCNGPYPAAPIRAKGRARGEPWYSGQTITTQFDEPFVYVKQEYDDGVPGELKAMYKEEAKPLMRLDLISAIQEAGVDNLQLFPAVIEDPLTGTQHANFHAFNIVGLVACADMGSSDLMGTSDTDLLDVDFDRLVIDESKTQGLLLFRLAEACTAIVVHDNVRHAIEQAGVPGMVFYGPGEWSG